LYHAGVGTGTGSTDGSLAFIVTGAGVSEGGGWFSAVGGIGTGIGLIEFCTTGIGST
jgi:hypothetical protein